MPSYTTTGTTYSDSGTSSTSAWTGWVTAASSSATTTNDLIWISWSGTGTYGTTNVTARPYVPRELTAEERAAQERRAAEQRAQIEAERLERADADRRAEQLLLDNLTAQQRETWEREQYIPVVSHDGQRHYRITKGISRNIQLVDGEGKRIHTYCAHPRENVPVGDVMLAQKLMLEMAEQDFLRIANRS